MLSPMSAQPSAIARPLGRWIPQTRRDLRLASGIVLFTYVTLHLSCHALGLLAPFAQMPETTREYSAGSAKRSKA